MKTLDEKKIKLLYNEDVLKWLAENSKDGKSGARDLRKLIRKKVEDKIAGAIIDNNDSDIENVNLKATEEILVEIQ